MKISEMLNTSQPTLSFEVFPPKNSDKFETMEKAIHEIADLNPTFMSVTYGAGGGTSAYTDRIAIDIQNYNRITSLAHVTCVSSTHEEIRTRLAHIQANGIENVMALRGDLPKDYDPDAHHDYHHAIELIREIKEQAPQLCIGGACYPEGHIENEHKAQDFQFLKEKVDAGVDFITTQMFFDNNIMYNFLYRIREIGVNVPVLAGIMPITQKKQIKRAMQLSGTYVPTRFLSIVDRFGDNPKAMKQAGIAYATDQIIDLIANGVTHIHVYTMNKPDVARAIQSNISEILK